MDPKVLYLSGKQGSGKTTLSDHLCNYLRQQGYLIVQTKFAAPLYKMQEAVRVVANEYGIKMPEKDGKFLQLIGTEWARHVYGELVWVNALSSWITERHKILEGAGNKKVVFIVDDLRFKSEFYNRISGSLTLRLVADEETRKSRAPVWRDNTKHQSEIDLDEEEQNCAFDIMLNTAETTVEAYQEVVFPQITLWLEPPNNDSTSP